MNLSQKRNVWYFHSGDDMELHRCVAAYLSDLTLIPTAVSGFQGYRTAMAASLDHAMWFHCPFFRADEFMLYECESPRTSKFSFFYY